MRNAWKTQAWTITPGQQRENADGSVRYVVVRMLPARDVVVVTATSAMGVSWPEDWSSRDFARLELLGVVSDVA